MRQYVISAEEFPWQVMKQNRVPEGASYTPQSKRLMDQVREVMQYFHYSKRSIESYRRWVLDFIQFNGTRHPNDMGAPEIERFLSHLAINRKCAIATQNQALNAIVFLYKHVLHLPVSDKLSPVRSKKPVRVPVVLSQSETQALLENMSRTYGLMARIM